MELERIQDNVNMAITLAFDVYAILIDTTVSSWPWKRTSALKLQTSRILGGEYNTNVHLVEG